MSRLSLSHPKIFNLVFLNQSLVDLFCCIIELSLTGHYPSGFSPADGETALLYITASRSEHMLTAAVKLTCAE